METGASTSRGIWGYACGVFAGVASASVLGFTIAHAGSILFMCAYLISLPLFLAGLGAGAGAGMLASVAATVGVFVVAPAIYGFFYLVLEALPAVGLIILAMRRTLSSDGSARWGSEGSLLTAVVAYPCAIFLAVYGLIADQGKSLMALTADALVPMQDYLTQRMAQESGQALTQDQVMILQRGVDLCTWIMPSLAMCAWIFSTLIAVIVAQAFLQKQTWNLRPNFSLIQLQVPNWVIYAAATTGMIACFAPAPSNYIGLNLAIVLVLPFFFVGLAIVHAWAAQTRWPTLALIGFYLIIAVIVHIALLVALLGAIDQWVDFRKRIAAGANNQGGKS